MKLIWSKVCSTIFITISITNLTTIVAWMCRGSYRGVPSTIQGGSGRQGGKEQKCMHACMVGSGQQGGKLSQDGKLSQGRPGRKCMHVWIWAARWKANARWKAIARLKAIARCTQVRQVEPGPPSWAAMVGSLSKLRNPFL